MPSMYDHCHIFDSSGDWAHTLERLKTSDEERGSTPFSAKCLGEIGQRWVFGSVTLAHFHWFSSEEVRQHITKCWDWFDDEAGPFHLQKTAVLKKAAFVARQETQSQGQLPDFRLYTLANPYAATRLLYVSKLCLSIDAMLGQRFTMQTIVPPVDMNRLEYLHDERFVLGLLECQRLVISQFQNSEPSIRCNKIFLVKLGRAALALSAVANAEDFWKEIRSYAKSTTMYIDTVRVQQRVAIRDTALQLFLVGLEKALQQESEEVAQTTECKASDTCPKPTTHHSVSPSQDSVSKAVASLQNLAVTEEMIAVVPSKRKEAMLATVDDFSDTSTQYDEWSEDSDIDEGPVVEMNSIEPNTVTAAPDQSKKEPKTDQQQQMDQLTGQEMDPLTGTERSKQDAATQTADGIPLLNFKSSERSWSAAHTNPTVCHYQALGVLAVSWLIIFKVASIF